MSDVPNVTTKQCKGCGKVFPATAEYFYTAKSGNKVYIRGTCKACYCEITRQQHAQRFAESPEKIQQQHRDWLSDPEHYQRYRDSQKQWTISNPEKILAQGRKWRLNNPEKANLNSRKAYPKYYLTHKESHKARKHRRRALEANAPGTHTAADIRAIYDEQQDLCAYCGIRLFGDYHLDHIQPISRGGTNWPDNLCLACSDCNLTKHDKMPDEWAATRGW